MKKAFFFSLDAFFAVIIFTLILVSVYGYFISTQELRQQYFYSEDLFNIFINTRMSELSPDAYPNIYALYDSEIPEIRDNMNPDLTIMEQIVTLRNIKTEEANGAIKTILDELTGELFEGKYGFSFNVEDWTYGEEGGNTIVSRRRFVSGIKKEG